MSTTFRRVSPPLPVHGSPAVLRSLAHTSVIAPPTVIHSRSLGALTPARMVSAPSPPLGSPAHRSMMAPPSLVQASPLGALSPAVPSPSLHLAGASSATPSLAPSHVAQPFTSFVAHHSMPKMIVHEVPVNEKLPGLRTELEAKMTLISGLEQQTIELKSLMADAKNSLALSLVERERINTQVLDWQSESQRLQAEFAAMQLKYEEVLDMNSTQANRIAELEALVAKIRAGVRVEEPATPTAPKLGDDVIDNKVRDYLETHPTFEISIQKVTNGQYLIGKPVDKKVNMKVTGKNVLVRAGGGYTELFKYLDDLSREVEAGRRNLSQRRPESRKVVSRVSRSGAESR